MSRSFRDIAVGFLQLVVAGKFEEAYAAVTPDFRHHNAYFPGDAASLRAGMENSHRHCPEKIFEIQRVLEDGNLVAVHSKVILKPDMRPIAVVHIFRFDDGKIAELWDIGQMEPEQCPNEYGMF